MRAIINSGQTLNISSFFFFFFPNTYRVCVCMHLSNLYTVLLIQSAIENKDNVQHSETFHNNTKFFPPAFKGFFFLNDSTSQLFLKQWGERCASYSPGSSALLAGSQRGLFSMRLYGNAGTSQPAKSSFLGRLQLLKSSFFRRARLLMLPGGRPGLTLYPAALVVPRGLPGLVLNPAALVVPRGRPVLVR